MATQDATWKITRDAIACDKARLREFLADTTSGRGFSLALHPGFIALCLYRISRFLFCRGSRLSARILWLINIGLTGADLEPTTILGKGAIILNPIGVTLCGAVGDHCIIAGHVGIGGLLRSRHTETADVGGGPGRPRLADRVTLEHGALVLGAVKIGNDVQIGPRCVVTRDLPDGAEVLPLGWRTVSR